MLCYVHFPFLLKLNIALTLFKQKLLFIQAKNLLILRKKWVYYTRYSNVYIHVHFLPVFFMLYQGCLFYTDAHYIEVFTVYLYLPLDSTALCPRYVSKPMSFSHFSFSALFSSSCSAFLPDFTSCIILYM